MPEVLFQGMCVFRLSQNRVRVLMPPGVDSGAQDDHHDPAGAHRAAEHKASLIANADDINLGDPNALAPDELGIAADGQHLAIWRLGGKTLTVTSRDQFEFDREDVLDFDSLHKGALTGVVEPADAAIAELVGGSIKASRPYPVKLEVLVVKNGVNRRDGKTAEVLSWSGEDATISLNGKVIALREKDAQMCVANVAAGFSPGFGGLAHFAGYYSVLTVKPEERLELKPSKKLEAFRVGGGTCIPPGSTSL